LPLSIWAALTDVVLALLGSESINGEITGTRLAPCKRGKRRSISIYGAR
jgi:hypothetical protein